MASHDFVHRYVESHGYFYIKNNTEDPKDLYCRLMNKGCPGQATEIEANEIKMICDHDHSNDFDFYFAIKFEQALLRAAREFLVAPREIYDYLANTFVEGASILSYNDVESLIANEQKNVILQPLENFQQLCDLMSTNDGYSLQTYYLKPFGLEESQTISIKNFDNDALLILTPEIISLIEIENIYISSTNAILPKIGNVQLLTYVLAEYTNHLFPVALVLWNKQSVNLVHDVISSIRDRGLNNIKNIFTEFNLKSVIQSVWLQSTVIGTFDSFYRILYYEAHIRQLNLTDPDHRDFIKKCATIILLPYNLANNVFQMLIKHLSSQLYGKLRNFVEYFQRIWIEFGIKQELYLFKKFLGLNNTSQVLNIKLADLFSSDPTATCFLRKVIELFNHTVIAIIKLKNNEPIPEDQFLQSANFIIKEEVINNIWARVSGNEIDQNSLVKKLSTMIDKYYKNDCNKLEILYVMQLIREAGKNITIDRCFIMYTLQDVILS